MGEMPQPKDTYPVSAQRITPSSTNTAWRWANRPAGIDPARREYGKKLERPDESEGNNGIIDCYQAQHVALALCGPPPARLWKSWAQLVDEYGWNAWPECINICDGNEVWIAEVLWPATCGAPCACRTMRSSSARTAAASTKSTLRITRTTSGPRPSSSFAD